MSSSLTPLQIIQAQLTRYISLTLLVGGTIGNILNCFIFTRRSLRRNSCSIYFLAASIANLVALYFGCLTRLLNSFNIYPSPSQMSVYCKTRTFFTYMTLSASTWFVVGACADRYTSSSTRAHIRSYSSVKIAYRIICAITVLACLVFAQMFVCFNGSVQGINCYAATPFCTTFNDFNLLISYSLLPPTFMFILGWLTIQNVHRRPVRRISIANAKDRQLTRMLIVQVFCVATLSLPISIQKIYSEFTINQAKSQEKIQLETFVATLVVLVALINTSTSFYMFTLTSKVFRKELKPLLFFSNRRQADVESTMAMTRRRTNNINNDKRQNTQSRF